MFGISRNNLKNFVAYAYFFPIDGVFMAFYECFFGICGMGNWVVDVVVSIKKCRIGGEFYLHFRPSGVEINVANGVEELCELPLGVWNKSLQTDIADAGVGGER